MKYPQSGFVAGVMHKAILLPIISLVIMALVSTGCPAGKMTGRKELARRVEELSAHNRDLNARVAELERKIALIESGALNGDSRTVSTNSTIGQGATSPVVITQPPSIPTPSGLAVVKLHPENAPSEGDSPSETPSVGSELPPLFGDDPGFVEEQPASGVADTSVAEDSPPVASVRPPEEEGVPVEAATLYESAVGQFHKGEFELAGEAFLLYLTRYPGTLYEASALFYSGECRYKRKKYSRAIEQFRRYLMKYPEGKEAPMAMLRLGMSFMRLEDVEGARKAFNRVIERFPDSAAAEAARQELENIL